MNDGYKQFFKVAQDVKKGSPPSPQARPKKVDLHQRRRPAPTPWRAIAVLSVSLAGLGFYVAAPDVVEGWLDRVEISMFGQAEARAEKSPPRAPAQEKSAARAEGSSPAKNPDQSRMSAENSSHFEKLKERKNELDLREKELGQLEEELQRQKVELDKRIQQLEEMRTQIAQVLKDRVELDQEKVAKLVDLYSNMKPKQAAEILATINEELAVEVLARMKKKSAAEIMNLLPADKAKILSEKYTGYRRALAQDDKG